MKGHHHVCAIRRDHPLAGVRPALAAVAWFGLPAKPAAAGWMARGTPLGAPR